MRILLSFLIISAAAAQPPHLTNAKVETRPASEFRGIVNAATSPVWIGYAVPRVPGGNDGHCVCRLETGDTHNTGAGPVKLEGPREMLVLYRAEQHAVNKVRSFTADCEIDGGGLPFYWLTGMRPADSIALLSSLTAGSERLADSAVLAVALHAADEADRALDQFLAKDRPDSLREKTVFWLGAVRGKAGYERLRRLMREDPADRVRKKAVFALSISKEPQAVVALIDAARHDADSGIRGEALFWLAQKAGRKAAGALTDAVENDPDTGVKKRAVFALSQLPHEEGVPLLIQVARTNRNAAVRKQAMFWLGQSKDPRALEFFEQVLKQ